MIVVPRFQAPQQCMEHSDAAKACHTRADQARSDPCLLPLSATKPTWSHLNSRVWERAGPRASPSSSVTEGSTASTVSWTTIKIRSHHGWTLHLSQAMDDHGTAERHDPQYHLVYCNTQKSCLICKSAPLRRKPFAHSINRLLYL